MIPKSEKGDLPVDGFRTGKGLRRETGGAVSLWTNYRRGSPILWWARIIPR